MGFYLRKSVRMGPLRLNLSKSGIGVSTGIPGLRVGTGPKGAYVQAGRGGLYYRKHLGHGRPRRSAAASDTAPVPQIAPPPTIDAAALACPVSASFVTDIRKAAGRRSRATVFGWAAFVVAVPFAIHAAGFFVGLLVAAAAGSMIGTIARSRAGRPEAPVPAGRTDAFETLRSAFGSLERAGAKWSMDGTSGGDAVPSPVLASMGRHPIVATQTDVPILESFGLGMTFLPTVVLVESGGGYGAVPYGALTVATTQVRVAEGGTVPSDAAVVDEVWEHANKDGGPDRRYKDNRRLPVVVYHDLSIAASGGLERRLRTSSATAARFVAAAIAAMAAADRREGGR